MTESQFLLLKLTLGGLATVGLFSVLYRENKFYRFFEHVFLGLAAGWSIVVLWQEVLRPQWWDNMMGIRPDQAAGEAGRPGFYLYAMVPAIGLLGYLVFSKRHNWMSRIPIGILLGHAAGQAFEAFQRRYMPQIADSMRPIFPTTFESWATPTTAGLTPEQVAELQVKVFPSEAINNLVFIITLIAVLSYFIFSVDFKSKFMKGLTTSGRWLMMIGFGAIFGSTVMMRFTLLIDRMYFVFVEWLKQGLFGMS